jgi:hypothetical protein
MAKKAPLKAFVEQWRRLGPELEKIRQRELKTISTPQALQNLAGAFEDCRLRFPPKPTSGLIQQQKWFKKLALLEKEKHPQRGRGLSCC